MYILFEDEHLKIASRAQAPVRGGSRTLLSFTGVGHGMGGINVQKAEFFGTGRHFDNLLFITDKTRSWGNQLDFAGIAERLAPFREGVQMSAIGNSMGGFLAIVAAHFMPMNRVIAFVPQFSVDPEIVPWETRWKEYRDEIPGYRIRDVGGYVTENTQYFVFSGGVGLDRRQARLFPVMDNLHHYSFPDIEHGLAADLKEAGLLDHLVRGVLEEDSDAALETFARSYRGRIDRLSPSE
jgi:hypothetical protein